VLILCGLLGYGQFRNPEFQSRDSIGKFIAGANNFRIDPAFPVKKQAFFCRQEERLWKNAGVNFKFRLGSFRYTEWMERKPNSGMLPPNP
jgi:hypothetical protein